MALANLTRMSLREYRRKRDFQATPEPAGNEARRGRGWSYVIQKHAASRLHYDFRLELDGVLKSWAVPKGPSLDPREKRLAVETEDHPVEYGGFEGVIPEGQYGGGTVMLWDRGTWDPRDDPRQGLREGKLVFTLRGSKLRGRWALVKLKPRGRALKERDWLLIKEKDEESRPRGKEITESEPRSVESQRDLDQIARDRDRTWGSNRDESKKRRVSRYRVSQAPRSAARASGARRAAMPAEVEPQQATLVAQPPEGDEWLHEMKFDGYRILARLDGGRVRLTSRGGHDWTERFPDIAAALKELPLRRALFDGEATVVLADGTTSFSALQNAGALPPGARLAYFAFDLLYLGDSDLRRAPLEERKQLLQELLPSGGDTLRYSDHVVGSGSRFLTAACRMALEGIVSKRRDGAHRPGRGTDWLKAKCHREQEVVIGGFTEPNGSREGIGALLVGVHEQDGSLHYAGKVGTGFTAAAARDLRRRLAPLETKVRPFAPGKGVPRAHFVEPRLVAQVRFTEWTSDGRMRHPSFEGLREDKEASEVTREKEAPSAPRGGARRSTKDGASEVAGVRLTHPERVVFPDAGVTKEDCARYYERVAPVLLPHLADRPLTLVRCPEGAGGQCFFAKHGGPWVPKAVRRLTIQEKTKKGEYLVVDSLASLVGLVQMNVLEFHTWNARASNLEKPDRIVFDLDPGPGVAWAQVAAAAVNLRERLERLDLGSFVKTTGGKGAHVVVPLTPRAGWDECLELSRVVCESLERDQPESFLTEMAKAKRAGRILLDYGRNHRGSTSVAAFSTRARPSGPVSVPVGWDELPALGGGDAFKLGDVERVVGAPRSDPWAEYQQIRQSVTAARLKKAHNL
jgi:bifunctional non-homologous end joining protein LigD